MLSHVITVSFHSRLQKVTKDKPAMTSMRQRYLFSILMAVTVLPLDAYSLLSLRQSNDPAASLKKCLENLEKQQAGVRNRSVFSRKISTGTICGNLLNHVFPSIPLLPDHFSEMQFGSGNEDPRLFSEARAVKDVIDPNFGPGEYAKFATTKIKKRIPQEQASMRNTFEDLPKHDGLAHSDISPIPEELLLDKPISNFVQNLPAVKNFFQTKNSLLNKLAGSGNFPTKTHYLFNNQRGKAYGDGLNDYNDNDGESIPAQNEQGSPRERILPSKRTTEDLFHMVNTEVAKRRRQTLSINNALMALTDMVMEHGREKLMRNRDNLRYHMYIQGK